MPWTVQLQVKEQGRYRHRWAEGILNIEYNDKLDLAFNNVKPKDRYFVLD